MRLTPRLKTIASCIQRHSKVADIGTDHGYVPVYLIEHTISNKVIATDINKGPLNNAKSYIESLNLSDKIETRLGNGLVPIKPNEVDTVIIAGMGGLLINDILAHSKEVTQSITHFVLQPMVASEDVRRYLERNHFKIVEEKLAKEGDKIYEIIVAAHGHEDIEDEVFYEVGKRLVEGKDPLLKEFLLKKLIILEKIILNLKKASTPKAQRKLTSLEVRYEKLKEVYKALC